MNIAHIGNTAGIASILSERQLAAGLYKEARVYVFDDVTFKLFGGELIEWNARSRIRRMLAHSAFFHDLKKYDVWHYHYPYAGLKGNLEERKEGKKYIKHYHGDDLRGKYEDDFCLVSTPDLLQYAPNGVWLPTPLNLEEIDALTPANKVENGKIRLAHHPYYKVYKRENYYEEGFQALDNNKCEIVEIANLPHKEALQAIANCDIVIGKILPDVGWFGKFTLEGMAVGKPVICYVSDELYERYRPPVYRTTKETFANDLCNLINDSSEQQKLSRAGRDYIRQNHDVANIVLKLEEYYQRV